MEMNNSLYNKLKQAPPLPDGVYDAVINHTRKTTYHYVLKGAAALLIFALLSTVYISKRNSFAEEDLFSVISSEYYSDLDDIYYNYTLWDDYDPLADL